MIVKKSSLLLDIFNKEKFTMKKIVLAVMMVLGMVTVTWSADGVTLSNSVPESLRIETDINNSLSVSTITPEKKYYIYLLAGRELYAYSEFELAKKYYVLALSSPVKINKTEAYINLIAIAKLTNHHDEMMQLISDTKTYLENNQSADNPHILSYLHVLEDGAASSNEEASRYLGMYTVEEQLDNLMHKKKYVEALLMFNPKGLNESTTHDVLVTYDLLYTLVHKDSVRKLLCEPAYLKYPKSYSYSIKICGALVEYRDSKKISDKTINDLEQFFKGVFKNHRNLLEALVDLR
jgi:hypothetical protein